MPYSVLRVRLGRVFCEYPSLYNGRLTSLSAFPMYVRCMIGRPCATRSIRVHGESMCLSQQWEWRLIRPITVRGSSLYSQRVNALHLRAVIM